MQKQCKRCGKKKTTSAGNICRGCRKKPNKCKDCKTPVYPRSKRCRPCGLFYMKNPSAYSLGKRRKMEAEET